MTLRKVFSKLRRQNKGQYLALGFCITISVTLVTAFALMYLGPTVQDFLPQGGDTRKLASLLLAVTIIGCSIFTLYASGLFFRYKSREYGVLLALGTPKKAVKPLLFQELVLLTGISSLVGLLLAVPLSFGIWKLFDSFLLPTESMRYRFGGNGFITGLLFCAALSVLLFLYGFRFIRKTNVINILKEGQKAEMVKLIPAWTGKAGIVMIIAGIFLGMGVRPIVVRLMHYRLPSLFSVTYVIALAGIYLVILSLVSLSSAGRHKEKYYKNLVSISMMRFSAKTAARNMCVTVLLLFCCLFAAFFGMLYSTAARTDTKSPKAFALHYPINEKQAARSDILNLADKYGMPVTGYHENEASNLVISYRHTGITENSQYVTVESSEAKLALFLSESSFQALSGMDVSVEQGTYKTITPVDYKEGLWDFIDGLYAVTIPDTDQTFNIAYGGSVGFEAFSNMSVPYSYILSDTDYVRMTEALDPGYKERVIAFDVKDTEHSYAFAKALEKEYVQNATALSDFMENYDAWEDEMAQRKNESYGYAGSIGLSPNMEHAPQDWKYAPRFTPVMLQEFMQNIAVYVMLCLYIFLIMLASVAIMSYVRSITVASDNKAVFESLRKLGADPAYSRNILKQQLKKIFQYPAIIGSALGWAFSFVMSCFNDMGLGSSEILNLAVILILILGIWGILYLVYLKAYKTAAKIIGIEK